MTSDPSAAAIEQAEVMPGMHDSSCGRNHGPLGPCHCRKIQRTIRVALAIDEAKREGAREIREALEWALDIIKIDSAEFKRLGHTVGTPLDLHAMGKARTALARALPIHGEGDPHED